MSTFSESKKDAWWLRARPGLAIGYLVIALALLALSAEWSVRAERALGGAVLEERVELVQLTDAASSLWPQFEQ